MSTHVELRDCALVMRLNSSPGVYTLYAFRGQLRNLMRSVKKVQPRGPQFLYWCMTANGMLDFNLVKLAAKEVVAKYRCLHSEPKAAEFTVVASSRTEDALAELAEASDGIEAEVERILNDQQPQWLDVRFLVAKLCNDRTAMEQYMAIADDTEKEIYKCLG